MSETIARLVSAKDAHMITDEDLPTAEKTPEGVVADMGDVLWTYRNENKINTIVVSPADQDLAIDSEELLARAFRLHSAPKSMVFWMSPDDKEAIEKYDALLQAVYDGKAIIVEEQKQYDAAKGKFMVWIRYDEVCWELKPRYSYLKEERK